MHILLITITSHVWHDIVAIPDAYEHEREVDIMTRIPSGIKTVMIDGKIPHLCIIGP